MNQIGLLAMLELFEVYLEHRSTAESGDGYQ
jgi:hypothetical protein